MKKEIKNTLFKFVTLRKAEQIESIKKAMFYVNMPNSSIENSQLFATDSSEFNSKIDVYVPLSIDTLKLMTNQIYDFSLWALNNRDSINQTEYIQKLNELNITSSNILSVDTVTQVWDNFIYQLYNDTDELVKEATIKILYGNFLLEKLFIVEQNGNTHLSFTADGEAISDSSFKRILNAKVVRPAFLNDISANTYTFIGESAGYRMASNGGGNNTTSLSLQTQQELNSSLNFLKNRQKLAGLETLKKELVKAQKKYQKLEAKNLDNNIPLVELDNTRLQNQLTPNSYNLYNTIINEDIETFQELFDEINEQITTHDNSNFIYYNTGKKYIEFGGVLFANNNINYNDEYTYAIQAIKIFGNKWQINLVIKFSNEEVRINNLDYTLNTANGSFQSSNADFHQNINGLLLGTLFVEGVEIEDDFGNANTSLELNFSTNNGKSYSIYEDILTDENNKIYGNLTGNANYSGMALRTSGEEIANSTKYGVTRLGIADYRKVEQSVCCYVAGEVAHIENIMAREYKEKSTKSLRRSENTITTERTSESENLTDTTSTERNEMQSEIAKIQQTSKDFNINASVSFGGFSLSSGFAYHNSKEESNNMSKTEARELTERALERIVAKVREERINKIIEEYTEENKHGFDNREGDKHIAGVYRWVDKIYKNEIFNYGKRLMYEFMIPEPSRFHHLWINSSNNNKEAFVLEKPIDPRTVKIDPITDFSMLNETNYKYWASKYNADVEAPPALSLVSGKSYSGQAGNGKGSFNFNDLKIVEGYSCSSIFWALSLKKHSNNNTTANINVGGLSVRVTGTGEAARGYESTTSYRTITNTKFDSEYIPVSITTWDVGAFALNVNATFTRTSEYFDQWKIKTFNAIIQAYEDQLSIYEQKLSEYNANSTEKIKTNPLFYREIEQTLLRKNCITYLLSHTEMGANFINSNSTTLDTIEVLQNNELQKYTEKVKFLEQAFEWEIMSYIFYPFYWGDKGRWQTLYGQFNEYNDPTFTKFMQSGMARAIVTVRPGFEDAVNWFLATGQVWNGSQPPVIGDDLYLSIVEELQNPEYYVEGSWETRVPSTLTLIQSGSIALNAEGLPCACTDVYDENGNLIEGSPDEIVQTDDTIKGQNPQGVDYWVVNPDVPA